MSPKKCNGVIKREEEEEEDGNRWVEGGRQVRPYYQRSNSSTAQERKGKEEGEKKDGTMLLSLTIWRNRRELSA